MRLRFAPGITFIEGMQRGESCGRDRLMVPTNGPLGSRVVCCPGWDLPVWYKPLTK